MKIRVTLISNNPCTFRRVMHEKKIIPPCVCTLRMPLTPTRHAYVPYLCIWGAARGIRSLLVRLLRFPTTAIASIRLCLPAAIRCAINLLPPLPPPKTSGHTQHDADKRNPKSMPWLISFLTTQTPYCHSAKKRIASRRRENKSNKKRTAALIRIGAGTRTNSHFCIWYFHILKT